MVQKNVSTEHYPLVSIVVTSFNGEAYIAAQLDSIRQQTYKHLEIIICDDNSSDNTRAITETHAAQDARIKTIYQHTNCGLHRNLESGLRLARGEYIAIADQDDIWRTDKIEKLLACLDGNIAAFSDSQLIDSHGKRFGKTLLQTLHIADPQSATSPLRLLKKNCVSGHALLFHRQLLDICLPFDKRMLFDRHLAIAASVHGGIAFHPEPLVFHRIHATNHTNVRLARHHASAGLPIANDRYPRPESLASIRDKQYESFRFRFELMARLLHRQTLPDTIPQADFFVKIISTIATLMAKEKNSWFRFRLLFALWDFERHYHLFGFRRVLRLCKGRKWYAIAESFRNTDQSTC